MVGRIGRKGEVPLEQEKIQALIMQVDRQVIQLNETVAQLQLALRDLSEENNRLRLMNHDLQEALNHSKRETFETAVSQDAVQESQTESPVTQQEAGSGKNRLQSFYDEGIHICHPYFGSSRQPGEECMFCQGLLDALDQPK